MGTSRTLRTATALAAPTLLLGALNLAAQDPPASGDTGSEPRDDQPTAGRIVPTNSFLVTGYGTVGYAARPQGDKENQFTASFSPILLFQFQDRILFEAEFEFELTEGVTETGLEYAQLDYVATDNLTLSAGKFLVPFGVFGERIHPTWINKFPSSPPIYGHHVAQFGVEPLMPILSDIGVMGRATVAPGPWQLSLNAYITQGPALEGELEEPGEGEEDFHAPEFAFPASSSDNNTGKMPGFRVDIALPPWFEVNGSFLNGDYDEEGVLDFTGWNIAGEVRYKGFEARGEYLQVRQEIETLEGFPILRRHGFYGQASYRIGPWEPVFRWTQVLDDKLDGVVVGDGARQFGFGLDYWFSPSVALMAGFELNDEEGPEIDNNRILVHVAFGY
jgi:hypothetical protein